MKKWGTGILIVLIWVVAAQAGSPVWKITDGDRHLYVGGTIHVLGEADYPLPAEFDRAYKDSRILVFETDIGEMENPGFANQMMAQMVYRDDRTLKRLLSPATFTDLKQYAGERGIPVETFNQFKPGLVMIFLTLNEIERLGAGGTGVDEFYFKRGTGDGRAMHFLESPMAQVNFLSGIGIGNEDEMIAYILKDVEKLPTLLPVMKKAWRTGDNELLYKETLAPLKKEYPDLFHSLMVERNLNWLPQIQKMMATPEVEFVLVGAAHLAGDQGLLELLREKGFKAENL
ncbi:MAG: TraB/GumN family protein [Desulfobacterales bacterium]|nr:TraB/GumN family protein [Desulfobacterales bacterium]